MEVKQIAFKDGRREEGRGTRERVQFTCSSWLFVCNSVISAVGDDVYSHPEMATEQSSPNVNIAPTTTILTALWPLMHGRGSRNVSCELHAHYVSTYSTKLFLSPEMHIRCLSNQAKNTSSEHTNVHTKQDMFL